MISHTSKRFREAFRRLPTHVQKQAQEAYRLFRQNPYQASLKFKQIHPAKPIYSVRIGRNHRAIGTKQNQEIIWFWIGSHEDYNNLIAQL
jgi:hypothetical protein